MREPSPSRRALMLAVALATLVGCSSERAHIGPRPPENPRLGDVTKASGCGLLVFGMFPAGTNSRTQRAYDAAVKQGGGTGLTDVKISYSWFAIPYVGLMLCTDVEGRVVL